MVEPDLLKVVRARVIVSRTSGFLGSMRGGTLIEIGAGSTDFVFRLEISPRTKILAKPVDVVRRGELIELPTLVKLARPT